MTQKGDLSTQGAVNLGELLTRVENDSELLCELIGIFKEDFPRLLQSLQRSVVLEDMKNVEATRVMQLRFSTSTASLSITN